MKTVVIRIDKETEEETKELIFEASLVIAKYFGSERIGDACNIMYKLLEGELFETDEAVYKRIEKLNKQTL